SRRGNAIPPYWGAPASFKRLLGSRQRSGLVHVKLDPVFWKGVARPHAIRDLVVSRAAVPSLYLRVLTIPLDHDDDAASDRVPVGIHTEEPGSCVELLPEVGEHRVGRLLGEAGNGNLSANGHCRLPNGSRLSCGRNARGRKEVERQTKRLAGEATQFFPPERPAASSAC